MGRLSVRLGVFRIRGFAPVIIALLVLMPVAVQALQPVYYGYNYLDIRMQIEADLYAEQLARERLAERQKDQQELDTARAEYWALVAAGRSDRKVQEAYAKALDKKDLRCMAGDILSGNFSEKGPNPLLALNMLPDTTFDGGILESAKPEYRTWVFALLERFKEKVGRGETNFMGLVGAILTVYAGALQMPEYAEYVKARNLAEYEASGLPYRMDPADFLNYLMGRSSRSDAERDGSRKALEKNLGANEVMALAEEVQRAPRNAQGLVSSGGKYQTPAEQFDDQLVKRFPQAYAAIVAWYASIDSKPDRFNWDAAFSALARVGSIYSAGNIGASIAAIKEHQPDYPRRDLVTLSGSIRPLPLKVGNYTVTEEKLGRAFPAQLGLREPERYLVSMALAQLKSDRVADAEKLVADYQARFGRDRCLAALQDARFIGGMWYADSRNRQDYELKFPAAGDREELSRWMTKLQPRIGFRGSPWWGLYLDDGAMFVLWDQLLQGKAILAAVRHGVTPELATWQKYQPGSSLVFASRVWIKGGYSPKPSEITLTLLTLKGTGEYTAEFDVQQVTAKSKPAPTKASINGRVLTDSPDTLASPGKSPQQSVWADVDKQEWELKPGMDFEGYEGRTYISDSPVPSRRAYTVSRETISVAGQSLDCEVYTYIKSIDEKKNGIVARVQLEHRIWTHPAIPVPGAESEVANAFWPYSESYKHRPGTVKEVRRHRLCTVEYTRSGQLLGSIMESGYEAEVIAFDLRSANGAGFTSGSDPQGVVANWKAAGGQAEGQQSSRVSPLRVGAAAIEVPVVAYAPSTEYSINGDFGWAPQLAVFAQTEKVSLTGDFGISVPQARVAFFDAAGVLVESNSFTKDQVASKSAAIKFALVLSDKGMAGYKLKRGDRLDLGQLSDILTAKGILPEFIGLSSRESGLAADRPGGSSAFATPPPQPGATVAPAVRPPATAGGDQPPAFISGAPPVYPRELERAGIAGKVTVEFVVTADGLAAEVRIISSTHREFEKPALDAVSTWRFAPGRKSGRPVNVRVQNVVEFKR